MARKSGNVTVRLLASVAITLGACTKPKPLQAENEEEQQQQQQQGQGEQQAEGARHGGGFFFMPWGWGGGAGRVANTSGAQGLVSNAPATGGSRSSTATVSRGGFGFTGSARAVSA